MDGINIILVLRWNDLHDSQLTRRYPKLMVVINYGYMKKVFVCLKVFCNSKNENKNLNCINDVDALT